jgi:uncharacterized protein (AIM24 family)
VAWIFGQRPKRQKHVSACSVTFANANHLVPRGVLIVRRSDNEMKRNAEVGFFTKSSRLLGITQSAVTQAAGRGETLANDQRYKLISPKK